MSDLILLFIHLIMTLARLIGPGGMRSVIAESVLVKYPVHPKNLVAFDL